MTLTVGEATTIKWLYIVFGFIHLIWGVINFILTFTSPCNFRFSSSTAYRGGGVDDIGLGDVVSVYIPNQFSAGVFPSIALFLEGSVYLISIFAKAPRAMLYKQIGGQFVPNRWVLWTFTHALIFAHISFMSGIADNWIVALISVLGAIGLNFAQSANEALNFEDIKVRNARDGTDDYLGRYEGYVVAFLTFAMLMITWSFHLANTTNADPANTWRIIELVVFGVIYFILLLLILFRFTNMAWNSTRVSNSAREVVFVVAQAIILLYISITGTAVAALRSDGGCPSGPP